MIFESLIRYHAYPIEVDWVHIANCKLMETEVIVQMKLPQRNFNRQQLFNSGGDVLDHLSGQRYSIAVFHDECLNRMRQETNNVMIWFVANETTGACTAGMIIRFDREGYHLEQFVSDPQQETCMALWVLLLRLADKKQTDLTVVCLATGPLQWPLVFSGFMQQSNVVNTFTRPCCNDIQSNDCLGVKYILQCNRALARLFSDSKKKSDIKH
jgi:hypothetical protein